jgi:hypothetical protein
MKIEPKNFSPIQIEIESTINSEILWGFKIVFETDRDREHESFHMIRYLKEQENQKARKWSINQETERQMFVSTSNVIKIWIDSNEEVTDPNTENMPSLPSAKLSFQSREHRSSADAHLLLSRSTKDCNSQNPTFFEDSKSFLVRHKLFIHTTSAT